MVNDNNAKIAGNSAKPKVDKIIFYVKEGTQYSVFLVRSPKYWSLVGGKDGLETEIDEEVNSALPLAQILFTIDESKPVRVHILRLKSRDQISVCNDYEIIESLWVTITEHSDTITSLTGRFWRDQVIFDYIIKYESLVKGVCSICGCSCAGNIHFMCGVENGSYDDDGYYDDNHDEEDLEFNGVNDDYEQEEGPCDDCDDKKMPYAERSCEDCPHGGPGCLGSCEVEESDMDDDDSYILDVWGPNAVNDRHGVHLSNCENCMFCVKDAEELVSLGCKKGFKTQIMSKVPIQCAMGRCLEKVEK